MALLVGGVKQVAATFGERLQLARTKRGLSKEHLAVALGVSGEMVRQYEQGTKKPRFENIVVLAKVLGVSSDWLLGLTDQEPDWEASKDHETRSELIQRALRGEASLPYPVPKENPPQDQPAGDKEKSIRPDE